MADTAGILRLMRFAADRLAEEDGSVCGAFRAQINNGSSGAVDKAVAGLASYAAASSLAETVLRMVADFMTETETTDG